MINHNKYVISTEKGSTYKGLEFSCTKIYENTKWILEIAKTMPESQGMNSEEIIAVPGFGFMPQATFQEIERRAEVGQCKRSVEIISGGRVWFKLEYFEYAIQI